MFTHRTSPHPAAAHDLAAVLHRFHEVAKTGGPRMAELVRQFVASRDLVANRADAVRAAVSEPRSAQVNAILAAAEQYIAVAGRPGAAKHALTVHAGEALAFFEGVAGAPKTPLADRSGAVKALATARTEAAAAKEVAAMVKPAPAGKTPASKRGTPVSPHSAAIAAPTKAGTAPAAKPAAVSIPAPSPATTPATPAPAAPAGKIVCARADVAALRQIVTAAVAECENKPSAADAALDRLREARRAVSNSTDGMTTADANLVCLVDRAFAAVAQDRVPYAAARALRRVAPALVQ